ncbi:MAG TPA: hypothetical protein VJN43_05350 [Bryobacteraceae bacterium]|nr:hypothetical protein [Bryobacteraceae bacterium]
MKSVPIFILAVLAIAPGRAICEVTDSAVNGFTVKAMVQIQSPPDEVYRRFIHNVGDWWSSAHTFSRNSHNLSIDEKVMGCFCEKLANGGSVRHLEVVLLAPGKTIVLLGGLGPLQSLATTGSLTVSLSPAEGGTRLEFTYAVAGYVPQGMKIWAGPVDGMLTEQFTRLKNYIEKGDPAAK